MIKNPFLFLNKENITIKIHFDMYHGYGNLDKAIDQLSNKDKENLENLLIQKLVLIPTTCLFVKIKNCYLNIIKTFFHG